MIFRASHTSVFHHRKTAMNTTNETSTGNACNDSPSRMFKLVFAVLLGVIGVLGNTFIIFIAGKHTVRKNLHHLIINLSLADIFLIVITETVLFRRMYTVEYESSPSLLTKVLCPTMTFLRDGLFLVVIFTLLIVSIERFRAVGQTLRIMQQYTLKRRVGIVVLVWVLAMGFSAFPFQTHAVETIENMSRCTYLKERLTALLFAVYFVIVATSHALIDILSFLTLKRLSKAHQIEMNLSEEQRKARAKRIRRVVKMVIASQALFGCSYLPLSAIAVWGLITLDKYKYISYVVDTQCSTLNFVWEFVLPLINSSASPYIYLYFLSDFREAAKNWLARMLAVMNINN